jgi:serine/threonine-protein kinase RsbW
MKCTIHSEFSDVKKLATALHEYCGQVGVDTAYTGQLELILVEAVNNVIEHAYENQPGHAITVEMSKQGADFVLMIKDQGRPTPETVLHDHEGMPDEHFLPEGGWGLGLINALADQIEFDRQGDTNILTLKKALV